MSAETDPFERVWFNRRNPETAHSTSRCAGERHGPAIPSFAAFVDEDDRCGSCLAERDPRSPDVPEDVPIGEELREVRDILGLTQDEVAERLGLAAGTAVWSWEDGRKRPAPKQWGGLRDLAAEADALQERVDGDDEDEPEEEEEYVCEACGDAFATAQGLGGHQAHTSACRCETCTELDPNTVEWYVHRTEDHGLSLQKFDHLEPGEFEARVAEADTLADLADRLGWEVHRVCRVLSVYGLADSVGRGDETPDGDDSWQDHYDRAAARLNGGGSA